ncbi:MAG: CsbD family protein [Candidatus Bathyarchaeia archaeon]|jgi:uncharacterized protein YjbJ (UPF0337 family)
MTEDELKGKGKQAKGKLDETAGKITGDTGTQIKGKMEQAEGKTQEAMGKFKKKITD